MKRGLFLFLSVVLLSSTAAQEKRPAPADLIITNARVYTVNPKQPWAEAVAVRGDVIAAVGSARSIARYRGASTKVIDAGGRLLLPGFQDSHIHFLSGSLALQEVDLLGTETVEQMRKLIRDYAAAHPKAPWVLGRGWIYTAFGEAALPHKRLLDEMVPDRPAFMRSSDGHTGWANSKALELAGITRDTPDPQNGVIVRDANGEPTGALKEAAQRPVSRLIPAPTEEQKLAALRAGIRAANLFGLTRVHSCGGDMDALELLDRLRQEGALTLRFYVAHSVGPQGLTDQDITRLEDARKRFRDDWLAAGAVKTMVDGVIESHTAAMLQPYSDDTSQAGKMFWEADTYKKTIAELDRRGVQVFTHAIGDAGVRLALDGYEHAQATNKTRDARHRVEHIEVTSPADQARFGKLGVIGSFQPLHANPSESWIGVWKRNVGPEREQRAFAWQDVRRGGARLAFGSDWPVVTMNPWLGLQVAVTRQDATGYPPDGWVARQKVTMAEAIRAYTLDAAYAARREQREGSIEAGKLADMILVSQNVLEVPANQIGKTEVLMTVVGGRIAHRAASFKLD